MKILLVCILLTGCYARVDEKVWENANKVCTAFGGLSHFRIAADNNAKIYCKDGSGVSARLP